MYLLWTKALILLFIKQLLGERNVSKSDDSLMYEDEASDMYEDDPRYKRETTSIESSGLTIETDEGFEILVWGDTVNFFMNFFLSKSEDGQPTQVYAKIQAIEDEEDTESCNMLGLFDFRTFGMSSSVCFIFSKTKD